MPGKWLREHKTGEVGVFPLFFLIVIGIVVVAGGTYIVREQFVKTGERGKTVYDTEKIREQIENPQPLPSLKPEPSGQRTYGETVKYRAPDKEVTDGSDNFAKEPSFTITPPAGWDKVAPSLEGTKVQFRYPEKDREEMDDGLYVEAYPQIMVFMDKVTSGTLEQLMAAVKSASQKSYEKVKILTEKKTTFAGQEAYVFETELFQKGAIIRSIDYYFLKDGYLVRTGGTALDSGWGARESEIRRSLNSLKLVE